MDFTIRERSPFVRRMEVSLQEAKDGVVQTLNPIKAGKWKLADIITAIGFADAKTAKKLLTKGQVKVSGDVAKSGTYELGEIILQVGDLPTVRVIGG